MNSFHHLMVCPTGTLVAADVRKIAERVDSCLTEANGKLHGLMIDAESIPSWKDYAAMVARLRFVLDHFYSINRVAAFCTVDWVVGGSNSSFLSVAREMTSHFEHADVRRFVTSQRVEAFSWLRA